MVSLYKVNDQIDWSPIAIWIGSSLQITPPADHFWKDLIMIHPRDKMGIGIVPVGTGDPTRQGCKSPRFQFLEWIFSNSSCNFLPWGVGPSKCRCFWEQCSYDSSRRYEHWSWYRPKADINRVFFERKRYLCDRIDYTYLSQCRYRVALCCIKYHYHVLEVFVFLTSVDPLTPEYIWLST